jgi:hypothetical protein
VAALVAGLTTPVIAGSSAASDADAALIAACAEAIRQDAIKDGINRKELDTSDEFSDAARDDWYEAFESVEDIPATTPEGLRAKARVLQLAVRDAVISGPAHTMEKNAELHERLAHTLCADILGMGRVA